MLWQHRHFLAFLNLPPFQRGGCEVAVWGRAVRVAGDPALRGGGLPLALALTVAGADFESLRPRVLLLEMDSDIELLCSTLGDAAPAVAATPVVSTGIAVDTPWVAAFPFALVRHVVWQQ